MAAPTIYTGFNDLYHSDRVSDITLRFSNVDFRAHKVFLMGAFGHFWAPFNSDVPVCIAHLCGVARVINLS